MKIIGHHGCSTEGGKKTVLQEAPFISKEDKENGYFPFLSEGYYFWDNNKYLAHSWARGRYYKYFVVEAELHLDSEIFFDLVGNRAHMILLQELMREFEDQYEGGGAWPLGKFIEFLRDLNESEYPGIFPFKASRAIDFSRSNLEQFNVKFVDDKKNYTNISPCLVVCLYEKNDVILQSKILINQN